MTQARLSEVWGAGGCVQSHEHSRSRKQLAALWARCRRASQVLFVVHVRPLTHLARLGSVVFSLRGLRDSQE